ncbi:MAG: molecular chaperone HtpG [Alphaproteobacteria bacterium]|nr:molecular chaperone HtpG [Alphaproteobacteria bacterium]
MTAEKHNFEAEVSRLLEIVAHSLYSEREVFLRELISNASDACDRLRYLALTEPDLVKGDAAYRITLTADTAARTLTVADNGIGMSRAELIDNLGTIARSGTSAFVKNLSGDQRKDMALIGQFGVGFYSAFMVADKVEVLSRKAGETEAHLWVSDGKGDYTVDAAAKDSRGTIVTLHLKDDATEFTDPARLRAIVKRHSDHIALPIVLHDQGKDETINAASALWLRPKSEITPEQYREFYHHVGHAFDEPWLTIHNRAEGTLEYTSLLFVPSATPFDLFEPERKHRVKLYVRRVFVTDDCQPLLPAYLRFLKGIVDSEDLPLNVSREMLQSNPTLARMRAQITKRVLGELAKKAKDAPDEYAQFWDNFGAVLKEGLYEDREHRDELLALARFRSTAGDGLVSLDAYIARMKPGQKAIYTISGDTPERVARSPQLEGFRARGVEVLLLTDPVDEFWLPALGTYKDTPFKSATRGAAELDGLATDAKDKTEPPQAGGDTVSLIALMKLSLGDAVKDVRVSTHLTDSAVCLVADEGDLDMRLERLLRQHQKLDQASKRILEINPKHPLIARLADLAGKDGAANALGDFAWVLLDQARILEGEQLPDPPAFARRLSDLLAKGLAA